MHQQIVQDMKHVFTSVVLGALAALMLCEINEVHAQSSDTLVIEVSPDTTVTITFTDWGKSINLDTLSTEQLKAVADTIRYFEKHPMDTAPFPDNLLWLSMELVDERCRELEESLMIAASPLSMQLALQYTISKVAFEIENPDIANDKLRSFVSRIESVLNAYAVLVEEEGHEDPNLEELQEIRAQGKLDSFVAQRIKNCD